MNARMTTERPIDLVEAGHDVFPGRALETPGHVGDTTLDVLGTGQQGQQLSGIAR